MINIQEGVKLHVIPTKTFKTLSIQLMFKTTLKKETITERALLSYLLETNSLNYPTQTDFRKRLSELYGAEYYTDVSRIGNAHILSINMDIVNDSYLDQTGLFEDVIDFLYQTLYHPHVFDHAFHGPTFDREVTNLKDEYASRIDDKEDYAAMKLMDLFFESGKHSMPILGVEEELQKLNPKRLYDSYKDMLLHDELDIIILGDIETDRVKTAFEPWTFGPRSKSNASIFQKIKRSKVMKRFEESQDIHQTKLAIGFRLPVYFKEEDFAAGLIFDGLIGGYTHSKLFTRVREKEGLAYAISSDLDSFRGLMLVTAGIDDDKSQKVEDMIVEELKTLQEGHFSESDLQLTKALIKNEFMQTLDHPDSIIASLYSDILINGPVWSIDDWVETIDAVTKQDVQRLAKTCTQEAVFLLRGEKSS
ncbi:EF-P 5-aminopentanol modification-associated protein YfmF [Alkalibacterium sp. MB6]|uniref:EF-P 5-aminopentanol modification-associated protein YfmF n=1 Tax=Alkalibacterium sp. MB6 TaxID=2081965 RepID=UPI00137B4229|nr:pitrilysin family protein [Alkalibacterium sp. MB6]